MGKKQHQSDRMYLTAKEWKEEWGGHKDKKHLPYQRLPFNCCAITFTPFEDPVCTADGIVYDVTNIVPYIQKYHTHPVSGEPLEITDLTALQMHKNSDGEYQCPVLGKVFTQHTHIVAVKTSGNVYCHEAIQELNIKGKNWKDLLTDEPFTRQDIIHIQNPLETKARELAQFDHIKRALDVSPEEDEDAASAIKTVNPTMRKVMQTLKDSDGTTFREPTSRRALAVAQLEAALATRRTDAKKAAKGGSAAAGGVAAAKVAGEEDEEDDWRMRGPAPQERKATFKPGTATWDTDDTEEAQRKLGKKAVAEQRQKAKAAAKLDTGRIHPDVWWTENYRPKWDLSVQTTGAASRSFTSTSMNVVTKNERVRKMVYRNPTKKAYLQLLTTKGALNLELHCDLAPRTCENFLALCEMGYYNSTPFHRSIRNFMVQGGDPSGTGKGGESIYGPAFADEMDSRLVHDGRGVLAMANSGKDTNASQFYILYKSARHLDFKHSVFGKVVGGLETLTAMEAVPTDGDDKPKEPMRITGCTIFVNPYRELLEAEDKAEAAAKVKQDMDEKGIIPDSEKRGTWYSNPRQAGAGSTLMPPPASRSAGKGQAVKAAAKPEIEEAKPKKRAKLADAAADFDAW